MVYLLVFLAATATDLIPFFGPPAWTIMAFMLVRFDLDPWFVLAAGVPGSVLGRYGLSLYVASFLGPLLTPQKNDDIRFAGQRLSGSAWYIWPFVFLYSLLPLSTTALFSAAGAAQVKTVRILPPFFLGKFISDAAMIFTIRSALENSSDLFFGAFSWKGALAALASTVLLAAFLFLDWRTLLERRSLRLNLAIWK